MPGPKTAIEYNLHFGEPLWERAAPPLEGREVVPALRAAFDRLGRSWSDAVQEASVIYAERDPAESDFGRKARLHRKVAPRLAEAAARAEAAVAEELARAARLRAEALAAVRAGIGADAALAAEIRAHARQLPDSERAAFVARAVAERDRVTVAALFTGPSYLSGLDRHPERYEHLKAQAMTLAAPAEMGKAERIERAAELVRGTAKKLRGWAATDFAEPKDPTGHSNAAA